MKKVLCFAMAAAAVACGQNEKRAEAVVLTDNIVFCESVLADGDRLLVGSFGTDELNPLNTEGKGYILEFKDTVSSVLIPADGTLSAPKGTLIKNNRLYIADVGKMAVYDLSDLSAAPVVVNFPEGELFVNDMAVKGDTMYVTVTNTGNIYALNVADSVVADTASLALYTNITGANGILIRDNTMYIASYPADGVTTEDNVLYCIDDISRPQARKLTDRMGQYDGLALSADGQRLYFTSWVDGEVGYYDFTTGAVTLLDPGMELAGPARIALKGDMLYIPDLPNSRVVGYKLK